MSNNQRKDIDPIESFEVHKYELSSIRLYFGLRALVFLICITICAGAVLPNGSFANPTTAIALTMVLLFGFVLAFKFSKPAILAALALPKRGRSIAVWNVLGIVTAVAFAANAWGYLVDDIAFLVICIAGTGFFLVVLSGSVKCFLRPPIGGAFIQMAEKHKRGKL
jgi:hypothetical protein